MPRRPKSGPPYTDIPKEVYIVVSNPWGMKTNPSARSQCDFDRVASWAQLVLQQGGLDGRPLATIECMYSMGTRDEIIIQFAEGTHIVPLLGEHRWADIAKNWTGPPNDQRSTRVFLYNWRNNGDPANHNWSENFPKPLPLDSVPAKSPYPTTSWIRPPSSLTNLVLPIPQPPNPSRQNIADGEQTTSPLPPIAVKVSLKDEDRSESENQDSASTDLLRPYEPPSQHPAHARFRDQHARGGDMPLSRASTPPSKCIKKLDPYELEEDALSILHAPDPIREDTSYSPLTDTSVQGVPAASLGYQPSTELEAYINAHLRGVAATVPSGSGAEPTLTLSIKMEDSDILAESKPRLVPQVMPPTGPSHQSFAGLETCINAHLRGATAPSGSGAREIPRTRVTVKREYEEDAGVSLVKGKRIKMEEV